MKILVTGSSGQLGSALVNHLRSHKYDVLGADISPAQTTDVDIDVQNKEAVERITKSVNVVIHTAAIHGKHYELNYPRIDFVETNILGTLNLLNACVKNGVKKFLFTSTTSIYGSSMVNSERAVWVDEFLQIEPRDIYDITKQTAEQLCKDFFYKEGLQASVYRVGRFLPEPENLKVNHRLYRGLDERDGAEALRLGMEHTFRDFEIFNISSGSPFIKEDLAALKENPRDVILKYFPEAEKVYNSKGWTFPGSIDRVYVPAKAQEVLGYEPKFTFERLLNDLT
ncbi:NAD-dependent epimerase/dehydratase family protein [Pedobacter sp. HMF7647]|uniref:NAD-dependent epimerase/dehydratase family protein n=1 Tax=Hufsiella arboris TaxID=2695275 RepID=A0A7K1Y9L1_9SPHI|nr:NAD(P)-dependent oxidoreductase [Hufsiella arboris]MXV51110.1 NAD-dependent epimerase/dehydratase family protein [Hufsiella arboris]